MRGLLTLYSVASIVSFTTLALTIASIAKPSWIVEQAPSLIELRHKTTYGLFQLCEAHPYLPGVVECRRFPQRGRDCGKLVHLLNGGSIVGMLSGDGRHDSEDMWGFCESWYTAGYAQQLSLVFALANLIALVLTLIGTATVGPGYRTDKLRSGWKLVAGLMSLQAVCLLLASSFVAFERNHNFRFVEGAHLGQAWAMTTVAYSLNLAVVFSLLFIRATGRFSIVPGEDGYEPIHG
ncbi:hypothetical protein JCM11641_005820 [Rhodosporidiobolus odoratus]